MLLLYILSDDWPIFMISGTNEQLQQQLEYTLLKHDCHSWWSSKMQSGHEDTLEDRYAIKLCFKLGKNATETYGILQTAFQPSCMNRASVFKWHNRFKEGRESVRDDERCGRSQEINTPELIGQWFRVYQLIGPVCRVFANGLGDLGSIPGHIIPKTLKMVLDTSLLNTQQYKIHIKGKVVQSRER